MDVETVTVDIIERIGSSLGVEGWSDPNLVVLNYEDIEREKHQRETMGAMPCWSFGLPGDSFDVPVDNVIDHNSHVSRILNTLGASGAGRRAVIQASLSVIARGPLQWYDRWHVAGAA